MRCQEAPAQPDERGAVRGWTWLSSQDALIVVPTRAGCSSDLIYAMPLPPAAAHKLLLPNVTETHNY